MNKKIFKQVPFLIEGDNRNKFITRNENENLIVQGTHVLYVFDEIGKDIYCAINNKKSVEDIINNIAVKYNNSKEQIAEDIIDFLMQLSKKGIIKLMDI